METSFSLICKSRRLLHSVVQLLGFCEQLYSDLQLLINCMGEAISLIGGGGKLFTHFASQHVLIFPFMQLQTKTPLHVRGKHCSFLLHELIKYHYQLYCVFLSTSSYLPVFVSLLASSLTYDLLSLHPSSFPTDQKKKKHTGFLREKCNLRYNFLPLLIFTLITM